MIKIKELEKHFEKSFDEIIKNSDKGGVKV